MTYISRDMMEHALGAVFPTYQYEDREALVGFSANAFLPSLMEATLERAYQAADLAIEAADAMDADDDEPAIRDRALSAVEDLKLFFAIGDEKLARAIGVVRTTFYNWEHGSRPSVSKVAALFSLHTLVAALRRRLGDDGAREWLAVGEPSRQDEVLAGRIDEVKRAAELLIFSTPAARSDRGYSSDQELEALPVEHEWTLTGRRPVRVPAIGHAG